MSDLRTSPVAELGSSPRTTRRRFHWRPQPRAARTLQWIFVVAFLAGLVTQFLLAGLAVFDGQSFGAHRILGSVLTLIAALILLTGIAGRVGRAILRPSGLLTVLTIVQGLLVLAQDDVPELAALHVVNAAAIVWVAQLVAVRAWRLERLSHDCG